LTAEIKDDIAYTSTENVRFRRHVDTLYSSHCDCECWACRYYVNYVNKHGYAFFSGLRQTHYQQLNQYVFRHLKNLRPQFGQYQNNRESQARLVLDVPTTSDFYENARRHMNQNLNTNIDELLEQLREYNNEVELINPRITETLNEIMNAPMPGPLSESHQNSIYEIVRACFRDVLLFLDTDILNAFSSHDMSSKVRVDGHGSYEFDGDANRAITIIGSIETNAQIRQDLESLRNRMRNIISKINDIKNQISEMVEQIEQGSYRRKIWRCCPSLTRELWHYI
jgi:archaellum component FlaC